MPDHTPTISEMVEALCLFDEPMLNSRYHGMLVRRKAEDRIEGEIREELAQLPQLVIETARLARVGALEWDRLEGTERGEFVEWAEYTILESFLRLAESQMRILAYISRSAPSKRSRDPFDQMLETHRHVATVLRRALKSKSRPGLSRLPYSRAVQEEEPDGDLRGQLERALRASEQKSSGIREIVLSGTGLRHLRDQGAFRDRSTFGGFPVAVDLGWDAPAFVIETFDRIPLEEMLRG